MEAHMLPPSHVRNAEMTWMKEHLSGKWTNHSPVRRSASWRSPGPPPQPPAVAACCWCCEPKQNEKREREKDFSTRKRLETHWRVPEEQLLMDCHIQESSRQHSRHVSDGVGPDIYSYLLLITNDDDFITSVRLTRTSLDCWRKRTFHTELTLSTPYRTRTSPMSDDFCREQCIIFPI